MKIFFVLLAICLATTGCSRLLKMPEGFHEMEVARLNLEGLSSDAARAKAIRAGFTCGTAGNNEFGKNTVQCDKKSPELICPQRRFLYIDADPKSGKVNKVNTRVVDNFCLGAW